MSNDIESAQAAAAKANELNHQREVILAQNRYFNAERRLQDARRAYRRDPSPVKQCVIESRANVFAEAEAAYVAALDAQRAAGA